MKILISVGTTEFDELIEKLMRDNFQKILKNFGVKTISIQNGRSKLNVSKFSKNFNVNIINNFDEYKRELENCDFGISHCGIKVIKYKRCRNYFRIFWSW